jgi:hypothetical protein
MTLTPRRARATPHYPGGAPRCKGVRPRARANRMGVRSAPEGLVPEVAWAAGPCIEPRSYHVCLRAPARREPPQIIV